MDNSKEAKELHFNEIRREPLSREEEQLILETTDELFSSFLRQNKIMVTRALLYGEKNKSEILFWIKSTYKLGCNCKIDQTLISLIDQKYIEEDGNQDYRTKKYRLTDLGNKFVKWISENPKLLGTNSVSFFYAD